MFSKMLRAGFDLVSFLHLLVSNKNRLSPKLFYLPYPICQEEALFNRKEVPQGLDFDQENENPLEGGLLCWDIPVLYPTMRNAHVFSVPRVGVDPTTKGL